MSETDQEQFPAPVSIGAMLREARERRGETLSDVAHALKLSAYQVEALEQERYDLLPGAAFVRGFLRNFARHVHLDLDARIAALDLGGSAQGVRLTTVTNASGEIPVGGESAGKGIKPALIVIAGMALVLGAGWYFDWFEVDDQPQATLPRGLPEPVVAPPPLAEAPRLGVSETPSLSPLPLATEGGASGLDGAGAELSDTPLDAPGSEAGDPAATLETGPDPEPTASTPELDAAAVQPSAEVAEVAEVVEVVEEAQLVEGAEGTEVVTGAGRLAFALRGESWIQVRDRDGVALYTGTNAPGSSRVVQGQPPFAIVVGNAAMVSLEFNGESVDLAPHTSPGGVARMTVQ